MKENNLVNNEDIYKENTWPFSISSLINSMFYVAFHCFYDIKVMINLWKKYCKCAMLINIRKQIWHGKICFVVQCKLCRSRSQPLLSVWAMSGHAWYLSFTWLPDKQPPTSDSGLEQDPVPGQGWSQFQHSFFNAWLGQKIPTLDTSLSSVVKYLFRHRFGKKIVVSIVEVSSLPLL